MSAREYYHHVMWYTVWDAKTGELVAAGTSAMCAAKLGYKNAVSFSAAVCPRGRPLNEPAEIVRFIASSSVIMDLICSTSISIV